MFYETLERRYSCLLTRKAVTLFVVEQKVGAKSLRENEPLFSSETSPLCFQQLI